MSKEIVVTASRLSDASNPVVSRIESSRFVSA